ncbi:MAG: hypothetical protein RR620_08705 [Clostridium sp.]
MKFKLNFDKFTKELETKKQLTEDEILVRELLEECSKSTIDYSLINKLSSRHFYMAQQVIKKAKNGDISVLSDLSLSEFVRENILSTQEIYEDDFDIY